MLEYKQEFLKDENAGFILTKQSRDQEEVGDRAGLQTHIYSDTLIKINRNK